MSRLQNDEKQTAAHEHHAENFSHDCQLLRIFRYENSGQSVTGFQSADFRRFVSGDLLFPAAFAEDINTKRGK